MTDSGTWFFTQGVISYFTGPLESSTVYLWENESEKGKQNVLILQWNYLDPKHLEKNLLPSPSTPGLRLHSENHWSIAIK